MKILINIDVYEIKCNSVIPTPIHSLHVFVFVFFLCRWDDGNYQLLGT